MELILCSLRTMASVKLLKLLSVIYNLSEILMHPIIDKATHISQARFRKHRNCTEQVKGNEVGLRSEHKTCNVSVVVEICMF
jgi:hypothetical protein